MVNKVTLIGRLGKDPEARALENGGYITKIRLATDESYKDKDGVWQTLTEWHSVVMWRNLAERAEILLKKGYLVYIEGKLTNTTWKDENGINRYRTEVKASHLRLLSNEFSDKSKNKEKSTDQEPKENPFIVKVANGTDDLPF
jgi:single-strand DNA-binding protein